jgi:hypothetical protein
MIIIDNTIISDNLVSVNFCCEFNKCRGACCVEGDAGAPLEEEEISLLEDYIEKIKPFMTFEGKKVIKKNGVFDYDSTGEYVTPLISDKECAFTYFIDGVAFCAIEKAYDEGKIKFQKPVSCHLYPVRVNKFKDFLAVNYHKWQICDTALKAGEKKGILLYKFLREPLIRKFGKEWYKQLEKEVDLLRKIA